MASSQRMSLFYMPSFLLVPALFAVVEAGYNRERCYSDVTSMLKNGSLTTNDTVFFRNGVGMPMSQLENPVLTLNGCKELCGPGRGWYVDIGPRLGTWIIPVFLLLSNMEVSPLDKRRYLMLLHLLGDPIDSLWSLLLKLESWSRCYSMAEKLSRPNDHRQARNLATVLGGIEELVGFYADPLEVYNSIVAHKRKNVNTNQLERLVDRTAQQLADSRTDERLRTLLATSLYFYQLVSAFVATVGGVNTSPPGGRIGTAMFMTWIIPTILLSNAIGGFTSVRTCFDKLEDFVNEVTGYPDLWGQLQDAAPSLRCYASTDDYFDSLCWSGAIYTFRPDKKIAFGVSQKSRHCGILLVLAVSPIIISSVIASVILWNTPPVAINCRNFLIFGIVMLIFTSAGCTWLTSRLGIRGRAHWHITLVKDTMIAIPTVSLIFLATSGVFNNCWCWSGVYSLAKAAHVPLNPLLQFQLYNRTIYPILVGICLLLQLLAFAAMMWMSWVGWNLMRWSEKEKRDEWNQVRRLVRRKKNKEMSTKHATVYSPTNSLQRHGRV